MYISLDCRLLTSVSAFVALMLPLNVNAQAIASPLPTEDSVATDIPAIVVTARRRAERLSDVPVSITAISGEALTQKGIQNSMDLPLVAPGLQFTSSAAGGRTRPSVELRGIVPNDILITQDAAAGIYINDIYYARTDGTNQTLFDLENVQVLYGPQGTLFGRNSTSGAVLMTTKRPTDRLEGEVWGGYGNYDRVEFGGIINVPINESVKLRVAGQRLRNDGYTKGIITGSRYDADDNYAGRASLLIDLGSGLENYTVVDYFKSNAPAWGARLTSVVPLTGRTETLPDGTVVPLQVTTAFLMGQANIDAALAENASLSVRELPAQFDGVAHSRTYGVANTTTYDISDNLTVKNIFGYRNNRNRFSNDADGSRLSILHTLNSQGAQRQISNELQLQGTSINDRLTWILGVYYFRESGTDTTTSNVFEDTFAGAGSPNRTFISAVNVSKSLFGQATYKLLDNLNFTAGGRYTWDDREIRFVNPRLGIGKPNEACSLDPALDQTDGILDCLAQSNVKYDEPTYTVSLDYKPTNNVLLYVAHRRGYRSGGFNPRATDAAAAIPFEPERVKDAEIGAKVSWDLGGSASLTTDLALYKTWYSNIQRNIVYLDDNNRAVSSITNAATATIKGLEFTAGLNLSRALQLSASWAHVDAVHQKFQYLGAPGGFAKDVPFGVSKNTVNGSVTWTPIIDASIGTVTFTGNVNYRSSWYSTTDLPVLSDLAKAPARTIGNISASWDDIAGSNASVQFWMRNVTNKTYESGMLSLLTSLGAVVKQYAEPRTYGITLRYKWGQ